MVKEMLYVLFSTADFCFMQNLNSVLPVVENDSQQNAR